MYWVNNTFLTCIAWIDTGMKHIAWYLCQDCFYFISDVFRYLQHKLMCKGAKKRKTMNHRWHRRRQPSFGHAFSDRHCMQGKIFMGNSLYVSISNVDRLFSITRVVSKAVKAVVNVISFTMMEHAQADNFSKLWWRLTRAHVWQRNSSQ